MLFRLALGNPEVEREEKKKLNVVQSINFASELFTHVPDCTPDRKNVSTQDTHQAHKPRVAPRLIAFR